MPRHREQTERSSSRSSKSRPGSCLGRARASASETRYSDSARAPVLIGTIDKAHGVRGAVVVRTDSEGGSLLQPGQIVGIRSADGSSKTADLPIITASRHGSGVLVTLEGITDREAARGLVGCTLTTARASLPAVSRNEYYVCDVIGLTAVSPSGEELGTVVDVITTGANDVWIVRGKQGEILVPGVSHAVLSVDLAQGRVIIDPRTATGQD